MGGYDGELTLVGAEAALPYQRPPLSKAYMKGEFAEERLYFKPAAWYEDNNVDLVLSTAPPRSIEQTGPSKSNMEASSTMTH